MITYSQKTRRQGNTILNARNDLELIHTIERKEFVIAWLPVLLLLRYYKNDSEKILSYLRFDIYKANDNN